MVARPDPGPVAGLRLRGRVQGGPGGEEAELPRPFLEEVLRFHPFIIPHMEALKIALLGGGTVGSAFYNLVLERAEELSALGFAPRFLGVLVRDPQKPRAIPQELLRAEPFDLLEADLVVEAMGGVEAPLGLLLPALEAGIPLITANKALLAEAWDRLRPFAEEGLIYHEASVMAGTPALSFLETLRGSELLELHGILNGTTLYILQEMEKGRTYAEALTEAQRLGYAEADPTLDVEGIDAAHKLTLLARLLVDPAFPFGEVEARGIARLTPEALKEAEARGGEGPPGGEPLRGRGEVAGPGGPGAASPGPPPGEGAGERPPRAGEAPGGGLRGGARGGGRGHGQRPLRRPPPLPLRGPGAPARSPGEASPWRREAPGRG